MINYKKQINDALDTYVENNMNMPEWRKISPRMKVAISLTIRSAMLSGMSLTAHYFAANEGHPDVTPQAFEKAAIEIGRELNLTAERLTAALDPGKPPGDEKTKT